MIKACQSNAFLVCFLECTSGRWLQLLRRAKINTTTAQSAQDWELLKTTLKMNFKITRGRWFINSDMALVKYTCPVNSNSNWTSTSKYNGKSILKCDLNFLFSVSELKLNSIYNTNNYSLPSSVPSGGHIVQLIMSIFLGQGRKNNDDEARHFFLFHFPHGSKTTHTSRADNIQAGKLKPHSFVPEIFLSSSTAAAVKVDGFFPWLSGLSLCFPQCFRSHSLDAWFIIWFFFRNLKLQKCFLNLFYKNR